MRENFGKTYYDKKKIYYKKIPNAFPNKNLQNRKTFHPKENSDDRNFSIQFRH